MIDIQINSTHQFEKDFSNLDKTIKNRVREKINLLASKLEEDQRTDTILVRHKVPMLKPGLTSSLFILRINPNMRVILTLDNDPLFNQKIVTLFRIVKHDEIERALRGIIEAVYQKDLLASK